MSSKFAGIFKRDEPIESPAVAIPLPSPAPAEPPSAPRRGRPSGKRSDPTYAQVTAYIPEELHRQVKIALLQDAKGQEFSELVGELLREWMKSRS
jgi:hypothetical protein